MLDTCATRALVLQLIAYVYRDVAPPGRKHAFRRWRVASLSASGFSSSQVMDKLSRPLARLHALGELFSERTLHRVIIGLSSHSTRGFRSLQDVFSYSFFSF